MYHLFYIKSLFSWHSLLKIRLDFFLSFFFFLQTWVSICYTFCVVRVQTKAVSVDYKVCFNLISCGNFGLPCCHINNFEMKYFAPTSSIYSNVRWHISLKCGHYVLLLVINRKSVLCWSQKDFFVRLKKASVSTAFFSVSGNNHSNLDSLWKENKNSCA